MGSVIQATGTDEFEDGLRKGVLQEDYWCPYGSHTTLVYGKGFEAGLRAGTLRLNLVVPSMLKLEIHWFHCTSSQKSSASIEHISKSEWFRGTTGTTINAVPVNLIT